MRLPHHFVLLGLVAPLVHATNRTSPPAGALVVGSNAPYAKIQDAVNALSPTTPTAQTIFIQPGTYAEQVYIPRLASALTIYGSTPDTSTYAHNSVTLTATSSISAAGNDDKSATLRVWTPSFALYNVNVENAYGRGEQAVALSAYATKQGYYACSFKGYQDTVLAETGVQVYGGCYVQGAVDYIFGQTALAWFTRCALTSVGPGAITASGRDAPSNPSHYVIDNSSITGSAAAAVGSVYLGRPWRDYARVTVQNTLLGDVVNGAGWEVWNAGDERTDHVDFEEWGNTGAGAGGTRASFAKKAGAPLTLGGVLGDVSWVDKAYVAT